MSRPEETLANAVRLLNAGRAEEAEALLREAIRAAPQRAEPLHLLGLVRHQRGDTAEAVELLTRAVEKAPRHVDAWRNLGLVCLESGAVERAEACFRHVVELAPSDVAAHGNLALIFEQSERVDEAIEQLRALRSVAPEDPSALGMLAKLLRQTRQHEEEVEVARELVRLRPDDAALRKTLSRSYFLWFDAVDRDPEKAEQVLTEWIAFDPEDPVARHMAAARGLREVPERAGDAYVARHFDEFAATYDEVLGGLGNQHPLLVEEALRAAEPEARAALAIADIGCGTGLCAPVLRPYARSLAGVDLSPKMLDRARARGLYDELVVAEVTAYLAAHPASLDLAVGSDVVPYFGELGPLFAAAARALRPGGRFVFTAELLEGEGAFRMGVAGRYAHAPGYVTRALEAAGLTVERSVTRDLRREYEHFVKGVVITARR